MSDFILSMNEISKSYQTSGLEKLTVLSSIDLNIASGDLIGLTAPSGAGKSTLLNALAQKDLAITSDVPGTTRDPIKVDLNLGGVVVELVDTAGLRKSPDNKIEEEGMKRARSALEGANLVLCVFDVTKEEEI